jgi:hypothetical protein
MQALVPSETLVVDADARASSEAIPASDNPHEESAIFICLGSRSMESS